MILLETFRVSNSLKIRLFTSWYVVGCLLNFLCALLPLETAKEVHNETIIGFGFRLAPRIIKASVRVIRLSLRLLQITQISVVIILDIILNLIQNWLLNTISMKYELKYGQNLLFSCGS